MADGIAVDPGATGQVAASLADAATALGDPTDLLRDIAARVAADATSRAPRRTGVLAGSVSVAGATIDGRPAAALTWGVSYGVMVNFGTKHMRAQPFASDALTAATADAGKLAATWAETIVGKV